VSEGGNFGPVRPDYSPLWDYGSHDIALALDTFGSYPTNIQCLGLAPKQSPSNNFVIKLTFNRGVAWLPFGNHLGEKRRIFMATNDNERIVITNDSATAPLTSILLDFCDSIRTGIRTSNDELALAVTDVLSSCEEMLS